MKMRKDYKEKHEGEVKGVVISEEDHSHLFQKGFLNSLLSKFIPRWDKPKESLKKPKPSVSKVILKRAKSCGEFYRIDFLD